MALQGVLGTKATFGRGLRVRRQAVKPCCWVVICLLSIVSRFWLTFVSMPSRWQPQFSRERRQRGVGLWVRAVKNPVRWVRVGLAEINTLLLEAATTPPLPKEKTFTRFRALAVRF